MKITTASAKQATLKISKAEWKEIGVKNGWKRTANQIVQDMSQVIKVPQTFVKKMSGIVYNVLKPVYFEGVPLQQIMDGLKPLGVSLIQEDGTEFSGFFTGRDGRASIELAVNGKMIENSALQLSWHKMDSGRYEITGYIS